MSENKISEKEFALSKLLAVDEGRLFAAITEDCDYPNIFRLRHSLFAYGGLLFIQRELFNPDAHLKSYPTDLNNFIQDYEKEIHEQLTIMVNDLSDFNEGKTDASK